MHQRYNYTMREITRHSQADQRIVDAIDLLDGIVGVQTHCSHWAAQAHSNGLTRVLHVAIRSHCLMAAQSQ